MKTKKILKKIEKLQKKYDSIKLIKIEHNVNCNETLEHLNNKIEALKNKLPRYPVGAIYISKVYHCAYVLIDWNGYVRFFNLAGQKPFKNTIKSYPLRDKHSYKVKEISRKQMNYLTSNRADEFVLISEGNDKVHNERILDWTDVTDVEFEKDNSDKIPPGFNF